MQEDIEAFMKAKSAAVESLLVSLQTMHRYVRRSSAAAHPRARLCAAPTQCAFRALAASCRYVHSCYPGARLGSPASAECAVARGLGFLASLAEEGQPT
jgi:hypothetical protein